jgi:hypothetical protein
MLKHVRKQGLPRTLTIRSEPCKDHQLALLITPRHTLGIKIKRFIVEIAVSIVPFF